MFIDNFSKLFDNTNLKAFATNEDIINLCKESAQYDFKTVAVNTVQVELARKTLDTLSENTVGITGVIAFPLGQTTVEDKINECKTVLKNGATEVDYVVNITALKAKDIKYVRNEMQMITDCCHEKDALCKVIFENAYLEREDKLRLCEISNFVGIDFVKTSTGFASPPAGVAIGATLEDVKLMRENTNPNIEVKAAGGINTLQDVFDYVDVGASRIGASAGVSITKQYEKYLKTGDIS